MLISDLINYHFWFQCRSWRLWRRAQLFHRRTQKKDRGKATRVALQFSSWLALINVRPQNLNPNLISLLSMTINFLQSFSKGFDSVNSFCYLNIKFKVESINMKFSNENRNHTLKCFFRYLWIKSFVGWLNFENVI